MSNGVVVISLHLQRRLSCKAASLIKQAFRCFVRVRIVPAASNNFGHRNVSSSELHTLQVVQKSTHVQLLSAISLSSTTMAANGHSAGHIMLADMKLIVDVSGAKQPVVLRLSSESFAESSHRFDSSSLFPHRHADSTSGSHGSAHQNLFVIIHHNGFDSQYRIKRSVPFSLSLAGIRRVLEADEIEYWTLHCTNSMYGQQVEQSGTNTEHRYIQTLCKPIRNYKQNVRIAFKFRQQPQNHVSALGTLRLRADDMWCVILLDMV